MLHLAGKTPEACSVLEDAARLADAKEQFILSERARARVAELRTPAASG